VSASLLGKEGLVLRLDILLIIGMNVVNIEGRNTAIRLSDGDSEAGRENEPVCTQCTFLRSLVFAAAA
jgi:hypothetical protein